MNYTIITKEQANKIIEFVLNEHEIKSRKDMFAFGFVGSTEDELTSIQTKCSYDAGANGYFLYFVCRVREMGIFESDEMIQNAHKMENCANATKDLNDLFENVRVEVD